MDEKKFETLSEQQQKKFLFKENIRLNELSQSLEEDRQLIDIQKGMLRSQQRKNQPAGPYNAPAPVFSFSCCRKFL